MEMAKVFEKIENVRRLKPSNMVMQETKRVLVENMIPPMVRGEFARSPLMTVPIINNRYPGTIKSQRGE